MKRNSRNIRSKKRSTKKTNENIKGEIKLVRGRYLKFYNKDLKRNFKLSTSETNLVVPGDVVESRVNLRGWAQIIKIIKRNRFEFLCYIERRGSKLFAIPIDLGHTSKIKIRGKAPKSFTNKDLVRVVLDKKSLNLEPLSGTINGTVKANDLTEKVNQIAISKFNLRTEWNRNILNEIKKLEEIEGDLENRQDLTHLDFVTIDGKNAKDFDDAVYAEEIDNLLNIYVAIADVSHYVKPDTYLDLEAKERSTSVYFRGKVLPMLPEKISNDLCSLRPNMNRLALVCKTTLSLEGELIEAKFFEAMICSKARLEYESISKSFATNNFPQKISKTLKAIKKSYYLLKESRKERGALELDIPEFRPVFDSKNKLSKFEKVDSFVANKIIEELMLLANISAARIIDEAQIPSIFRVHPKPEYHQIKALEDFLRTRKLNVKLSENGDIKEFSNILEDTKSRNDSQIISLGILQNLNLAIYQREVREHFALAYKAYTHFTSPIRRYPDLMIHRCLKELISQNENKEVSFSSSKKISSFKNYPYSPNDIDQICISASEKERIAESASRDALDTLRCELAAKNLGKVFSGSVSHIAEFGLFVMIDRLNIEGLCHVRKLPGRDYYQFDPVSKSLTTRFSKKGFYLGDNLNIRIKSVDVYSQRIDLEIIK